MFDVRKELGVKSVRSKVEKRSLERIGHMMRLEDLENHDKSLEEKEKLSCTGKD
jgi:hypothetical protein